MPTINSKATPNVFGTAGKPHTLSLAGRKSLEKQVRRQNCRVSPEGTQRAYSRVYSLRQRDDQYCVAAAQTYHELKSAVCVKKATIVFLPGVGSHACTRSISSPFEARFTRQLLRICTAKRETNVPVRRQHHTLQTKGSVQELLSTVW